MSASHLDVSDYFDMCLLMDPVNRRKSMTTLLKRCGLGPFTGYGGGRNDVRNILSIMRYLGSNFRFGSATCEVRASKADNHWSIFPNRPVDQWPRWLFNHEELDRVDYKYHNIFPFMTRW